MLMDQNQNPTIKDKKGKTLKYVQQNSSDRLKQQHLCTYNLDVCQISV